MSTSERFLLNAMECVNDIRTNPITEDYEVFSNEILGLGVNGKVYKCENIHNQRIGALKVF